MLLEDPWMSHAPRAYPCAAAVFAGCLSALWQRTKEELGWTWPHLKSLSGFAFLEALYDVVSKDLPFAFSSREKLMRSLRQARAQLFTASCPACICCGLQAEHMYALLVEDAAPM